MTTFHVGDWVVAANPVNEDWSDDKGLVTRVFPDLGRMTVQWYKVTEHSLDYASTDYAFDMTNFRNTTVEQ